MTSWRNGTWELFIHELKSNYSKIQQKSNPLIFSVLRTFEASGEQAEKNEFEMEEKMERDFDKMKMERDESKMELELMMQEIGGLA